MHQLLRIPLLIAFVVNHIQPVYSQCSGTTLVLTVNDTYQVFTSLNYPSGYSNSQSCEWRLEADNATDAIRFEVTDSEIEYHADCLHDYGEAFDGDNVNATSLGKFCGTSTPVYISYSSNMTVTFSSDYSMSKKGFKARCKSGPRSTLIDEEAETSIMMYIIAGCAGGATLIIVVVVLIVCKKAKSKKGKDVHPIQVQPAFAVASKWSHRNHHHPPPAYGDGNVSTLSPPPRYSDVGLHPLPTTFKRQGDGVRNTHFVLPDNLRKTSTQIGITTNDYLPQDNGFVTTNIANSTKPDPLPNENNVISGTEATTKNDDTSIEQPNTNDETADNPKPPVNGTETAAPHTDVPTMNNLGNVNPRALPRRNVPGETLSEVMSDSEGDSESDSDYYESDD